MMKIKILTLYIFSGLLACNPEKITTQTDKDGVVTKMPSLWKSSISDGTLAYGLYHGYVIDGKGVLSIAMRKSSDPKKYGEFYLQLKDVITGENIWTWDDFYDKILVRTLNESIVVHENKMILHDLWADYCIDTKTGKTIWKNQRGFGSASELNNIGDQYFMTGLSPASKALQKVDDSMYMGEFDTENIEELIKPSYSGEYKLITNGRTYIGSIYRHKAFMLGAEKMLLISYDELGPEARYNNTRSFFGLYNISQKKWIYDRAPLSIVEDGAAPSLMPIIDIDKVYLTSFNSVGCFELETGKRIWQYRLTDSQMIGLDIIKVDNKLIINGTDGNLYCINSENGSQLWVLQSGSLSSDIYHQDGIIYGIKGDNLRAYDLQTGKTLWNMPSPDIKEGAIYNGFVTGIPTQNGKKGRIFASTEMNVYCFEAVN